MVLQDVELQHGCSQWHQLLSGLLDTCGASTYNNGSDFVSVICDNETWLVLFGDCLIGAWVLLTSI